MNRNDEQWAQVSRTRTATTADDDHHHFVSNVTRIAGHALHCSALPLLGAVLTSAILGHANYNNDFVHFPSQALCIQTISPSSSSSSSTLVVHVRLIFSPTATTACCPTDVLSTGKAHNTKVRQCVVRQ